MFEFEMVVAFGAGAALMAMAPVVRKLGNQELGIRWVRLVEAWPKVESKLELSQPVQLAK